MSGNKNIVYWDACLFYAHIKKEITHGQDILDAIREMADKMDNGGLYILTSTLTLAEVLRAKLIDEDGNDRNEDFKKLRYKPRLLWKNVTTRITELAQEIRDEIHNETRKRIGTPDAIHLSTAIINRVDVFYTLDKNNSNKTLGLLPLSQKIHQKYRLVVSKPKPDGQTKLDLEYPDKEKNEEESDGGED